METSKWQMGFCIVCSILLVGKREDSLEGALPKELTASGYQTQLSTGAGPCLIRYIVSLCELFPSSFSPSSSSDLMGNCMETANYLSLYIPFL